MGDARHPQNAKDGSLTTARKMRGDLSTRWFFLVFILIIFVQNIYFF
jgi:hypothetical protein